MRKLWKKWAASLAVLAGTASGVIADVPGAIPGPVPGAVPAPAPAPAPANLFSFLCPTSDQMAACKQKICNSMIGQFMNNAIKPVSIMSGGMIGGCCPAVNPADLAKPADTPGGAAARVKADELDAKKRIADIRVLAGADCSRWPEAQDALINALRLDRNECVRVEAALALNRGCCCTRAVIKALVLTVSGGTEDGAPPERSPRVRSAAQMALEHCLACYVEVVPAPIPVPVREGPKELPKEGPRPGVSDATPSTTDYYHKVNAGAGQSVVGEARRALATQGPVNPAIYQPAADHSISSLVQSAWQSPQPTVQSSVVVPVAVTPIQAPTQPAPMPAAMPQPLVPVPAPSPYQSAVSTPPLTTVSQQTATPSVVTIQPAPPPERKTLFGVIQKAFHSDPQPSSSADLPPLPESSHKVAQTTPVAGVTIVDTTHAGVRPVSASSGASDSAKLLTVLATAESADVREMAAHTLAAYDHWSDSAVVPGLLRAASNDKAANVRAACIRAVVRLNDHSAPVLIAMQSLRTDPDPLVRAEADRACRILSQGSANAANIHAAAR